MRPCSLAALPPELLLRIQNFTDPLDILSLRQTCTRLSATTYDRGVWQQALRSVCAMHQGFLPSFPLESMSCEELEQAALKPYRFSARLLGSGNTLEPSRLSQIPAHLGFTDADWVRPFVVPGGRFLLLYVRHAMARGSTICLVDLGDLNEKAGAKVIASVYHRGKFPVMMFDVIETDPPGIRVYAESTKERGLQLHSVHVYDIYPLAEKPAFELVGRLTNEDLKLDGLQEILFLSCAGTILAALIGNTVAVWDMALGRVMGWRVETEDMYSEISLAMDGSLLLFPTGLREIHRWRLPELVPMEAFTGAVGIPPATEVLRLTSPGVSAGTGVGIRVAPIIYSHTGVRPLRLVYVTDDGAGAGKVLHHFDLSNGRALSFVCEGPRGGGGRGESFGMGYFCGHTFLQPWLGEGRTSLMVTVCGVGGEHRVVRLWSTGTQAICTPVTNYCPLTARFCIVTYQPQCELYILQF